MIWNPSAHQHLAGPVEHRKPWGSSWRRPITVNGVVLNRGAPGSVQLAVGGKGHPGSTGRSGTWLEPYCSQWDSCSPSWWCPTTPDPVKALLHQLLKANCITATRCICHHCTQWVGHILWGLSLEASLWVQLKKGRLVTVKQCMRIHLCCENLSSHTVTCSPFLNVTQRTAFSFQSPNF